MTILGLDLSTSRTGTALLEKQGEGHYKLTRYSDIEHDDVIASFGAYPLSFILALTSMADKISALVESLKPDTVVIEETNSSKARYTQKSLEMLHCLVLQRLMRLGYTSDTIKYVSTGVWRRAVGIELTKDQRKQNARLSKEKRRAKLKGAKLDKKALGIAGKVTKKHLAVAWANEKFGLALKQKHNDIAEAVGLAVAFAMGAPVCDGK